MTRITIRSIACHGSGVMIGSNETMLNVNAAGARNLYSNTLFLIKNIIIHTGSFPLGNELLEKK